MKKAGLIIVLILISFLNVVKSQNDAIDSLEKELSNHNLEDTTRVILLNKTAYKLHWYNIDRTLEYVQEAIKLADSLKFAKGKAESMRIFGIYHTKLYLSRAKIS
jgi:GTPase SAR1 family protein